MQSESQPKQPGHSAADTMTRLSLRREVGARHPDCGARQASRTALALARARDFFRWDRRDGPEVARATPILRWCGACCERFRHPSLLCPSLTLGRSATLSHDALTAAASLADMVTDLLVLREFYVNGLHSYFATSLSILVLAQLSFAFLFTVEHTNSRHRPHDKVVVFFCVLPVAQFVPILSYVTATFNVKRWDNFLKKYGLEREQLHRPELPTKWEQMQAKVFSHRGFILEAFTEAIPQCGLQVVAALSDSMSAIGAISILLSIGVVASKSWAVAYSPHSPTMIFNALTMVADTFCFFGTLVWLFVVPASAPWSGSFRGWMVSFFGLAIGAGAAAALSFVIFSTLDETVQRRRCHKTFWIAPGLQPLMYVLGIVPVTVVFLLLRWTLLPICLNTIGQEETEHAQYVEQLLRYIDEGTWPGPSASRRSHTERESISPRAGHAATSGGAAAGGGGGGSGSIRTWGPWQEHARHTP